MAKGIYQKYSVATKNEYGKPVWDGSYYLTMFPDAASLTLLVYSNFAWSKEKGIVGIGNGIQITATPQKIWNASDYGYEILYWITGFTNYRSFSQINHMSSGGSGTVNVYAMNARSFDSALTQTEIKGSYLTDVIAEYGSLPADGKHTDGYWYVFLKMASDLKANDTGLWRDIPTGWVNVNGMWKPQSELKANVQGVFK